MTKIVLIAVFVPLLSWAGEMHHHAAVTGDNMMEMPKIKTKRVYTVKGDEDFGAVQGFGKHESMVRMMTLMMVEGSGMEGMEMAPMTMDMSKDPDPLDSMPLKVNVAMDTSAKTYSVTAKATVLTKPPKTGDNKIEIQVTDPTNGKPVSGLKLSASVAMTTMDMGTEHPTVKELGDGRYELTADFSMAGSWEVKLSGKGAKGEDGKSAALSSSFVFEAGDE